MRFTPIQLTICVILVASSLLSLLRFGGTSRRHGGNGNGSSNTYTITTITTTRYEHDVDPVPESIDHDAPDTNDEQYGNRIIPATRVTRNTPSDNDEELFTVTDDASPNNNNGNGADDRVLPYALPHHTRPIVRLKPSAADALQRRAQFGTLFRSPLSSGQVSGVIRDMTDDGFDRVWLPALADIEAARAALLIHDHVQTDDALRIAELQLAADMILYRSWRVDCVSGAIDRCNVIRQAVESLHQKLLGVLTSPLLQRIKCQLKHYTTQRPGVTNAQRSAAREQWMEKESEFSFQVALCGQGDLSSCQYLKQLLLSTSTNSTRDGTPDYAISVLCNHASNIKLCKSHSH
jgi:hypothetical protein